jgi:hypothetical protein
MTLKSSARDMAKCEQRLLFKEWPALVISALREVQRHLQGQLCPTPNLEEVGDQWHASSAAGASLGLGLQVSNVVDAVVLDAFADLALGDVL